MDNIIKPFEKSLKENKENRVWFKPILIRILNDNDLEIIASKPSHHKGTFPAQILTCKLSNGMVLTLLFKYAPWGTKRYWNIEYEGLIYDSILKSFTFPQINYYGSFSGEAAEQQVYCLVLEYLNKSTPLANLEPADYIKGAEWIANFHIHFESTKLPGVKVYDQQHYLSIVEFVQALVNNLDSKFFWLFDLCNYFKENINVLTQAPQTCIHGEYYGKNILMKKGTVYPVDWETAAIAPGEIDLAALIDREDAERSAHAISSYKSTRWGQEEKVPTDFEERLLMAKIYYQLKWVEDWKLDSIKFTRWLNSKSYHERLLHLMTLTK